MKTRSKIILISIVITILIYLGFKWERNKVTAFSSESEFPIVEQTIKNALGWAKNKDFVLLHNTLSLDSTYLEVNPTDRIVIGYEMFKKSEEFFANPEFKAIGFEITDLHINFSRGGDVAWFYCHLNDLNEWKGQPANWENTRWTGVLEKIDGNWKIRQQHFSYPKQQ